VKAGPGRSLRQNPRVWTPEVHRRAQELLDKGKRPWGGSRVTGHQAGYVVSRDPYRARFTLVFDREEYSPAFFKEMWSEHRIACLTYHKHPKGEWVETIERRKAHLAELKVKRKQTPKHVPLGELPEADRFDQVGGPRKQFVDTIKMIAYRAETAMATLVRESLAHGDEARALLREIYRTEADLVPDERAQTLTVRLHHLTNPLFDRATRALAQHLNATETVYPGTELHMRYELVSD